LFPGLPRPQGRFYFLYRGKGAGVFFGVPRKRGKPVTALESFDCPPEIKSLFLTYKPDYVSRPGTSETKELTAARINTSGRFTILPVTVQITTKLLLVILCPRIYLVAVVIKSPDYRDLFSNSIC